MSYSRWSNSRWYTFWSTSDAITKGQQQLSVDCVWIFEYRTLVNELPECLAYVRECIQSEGKEVTDEELEELRGYMIEFIQDVDIDFKRVHIEKDTWRFTDLK